MEKINLEKISMSELDSRQFRHIIDQKLSKSGEKERYSSKIKTRLKEFLRQKLAECGWREEIKHYCKGIIPPFYNRIYSNQRTRNSICGKTN